MAKAKYQNSKPENQKTSIIASQKVVNIIISDELHKQAKAISVLTGKSLSDFIREAISNSIENDISSVFSNASSSSLNSQSLAKRKPIKQSKS